MNKITLRLTAIALVLLVLVSSLPVAKAQDDALQYGQTVKGELTNKTFEINYTFKGEKGDVIVARMARDGYTGGLEEPDLLLVDSSGKVVADTTKAFPFSTMVLPVELPAKDEYTLVATRRKARAGKSVGKFVLSLIKPDKLVVDTAVKGRAIYTEDNVVENFYLVEADGAFDIVYKKQSGKFFPSVSVNTIEENELKALATLSGNELNSGTIGILGRPKSFYIIKVGRELLSFIEGDADYTLTLKKPSA